MITFERTQDYEMVRYILTHPRIYPHISDDCSPAAADYRPIESEAIWYVLAKDVDPKLSDYIDSDEGPDTLGLWMFVPQNGVCWEVHTALLPCAWGDVGLTAARLLPDWIWRHTPCRRIITNVPATNRLAMHFARRAGMKIFGANRASYMKGGKLWDQICLGLSPGEPHSDEAETLSGAIEQQEELCQQR